MKRHLRLASVVVGIVLTTLHVAGQVATPSAAGRLVENTVPAEALKGNLLGDPAESRIIVYLPPGYDSSPTRRYPTVYLLHGYYGNQRTFSRGFAGFKLEVVMDELIKRGVARETIVVVPSGRNAYFGSFYANSPVTGGWEDFFAKELVAWVDKEYRTVPAAASRGIAGHSMGGYGSIMLAMKHPDVFGALYALSPCCVGLEGDLTDDNPAWHDALKMNARDQLSAAPKSMNQFFSTVFISLAAALSPNPQKGPLFVDLPYAEASQPGRLRQNEPAYAKWRASMPLYLVEQYRANLAQLRGIYLDYGALEEFTHIRTATRAFSQELAARGIGHTFEVYPDGDHSNKIRERIEKRVFRFFADVLSVPATGGSTQR
jgi:S-formylglutathione hydrolase